MKSSRVISLFAGIGGFDLGLDRAGCRVVAQIEQDANCQQILSARWPDALLLGDILSVPSASLPACDILCGGWPCQGLSVAGQRAGLADERSGLFYQFTRLAYDLQPPFLVWENVPGLLSSDDGRDMFRVVRELQRIGYCGAWRSFDAQYLGLAQRRRRVLGVFARSHLGAAGCAEILSLAEGMRWHPAPGRETGEEVTGTLTRGAHRGSAGGGDGRDGLLIAGTLQNNGKAAGSATQQDAESGLLIPGALTDGSRGYSADAAAAGHYVVAGTVSNKWRKGSGGPAGDECQNLVAHTLTAKGFDASEDGTGHGTPIIAFSCKDHGADAGELAPTLRSMNHHENHANGGGQVAVLAETLTRNWHRSNGAIAGNNPGMINLGISRRGVRRLTPLECERLQGFPDEWTAGFSDSVRYQMLGNAAPPPLVEWVGRRLVKHLQASP